MVSLSVMDTVDVDSSEDLVGAVVDAAAGAGPSTASLNRSRHRHRHHHRPHPSSASSSMPHPSSALSSSSSSTGVPRPTSSSQHYTSKPRSPLVVHSDTPDCYRDTIWSTDSTGSGSGLGAGLRDEGRAAVSLSSATTSLASSSSTTILPTPTIPPPTVSSPSFPPPPTRHPDFWLYDGSIVLSVQSTLFRVHQTILATYSELFRDLFTLPQGGEGWMIEGCHVVILHDSETDFEDLLKAVYVPDHFDSISPDSDLDTILTLTTGILRLSTKYLIRHLRQKCITLLLSKLPNTFAGYEAKSLLSTSSDRYRSDTIMRAISIAKETSVLEALPYAYYCLSRFPQRRFLKDRPGDISWKDKMIILIARERLGWAQMSLSHRFLLAFQRAPGCVSALCAHARSPHAEWHELERATAGFGGSGSGGGGAHPLRAYEAWDALNVCHDCVAYCQARHLEGRKEVWKYLPVWFELGTWEELRRVQNM